jgi:hypothetical protein
LEGGQQLPAGDEAESLFVRISESSTFRTAPIMRSLLLYLWQHRTEPINEYAIAVEALGRRTDFDPKTDAIVRVQIARLRTRLKDFYEHEGKAVPLQLSIPLGGHKLEYSLRSPSPLPVSENKQSEQSYSLRSSRMFLVLAGVCVALVLLSLFLFLEIRVLKASGRISPAPPSSSSRPLPRFWQSFLGEGRVTTIVLPTRVYLSWPGQRMLIRDLSAADYEDPSESADLSELEKKWGAPTRSLGQVLVSHMIPGVKLLQYLGNHGGLTD